MTRKLRLLVDCDEVLADFQTPALQIVGEVTGRISVPSDFEVWDVFEMLSPEDKAAIWAKIDQPGWCLNLKPFEQAQAAIATLREVADVYALTSPHHSPNWYWERVEWLKKHFDMDKKYIIQTSSKYMVRGDVFIDDNPDHILAWRAEHPDKTCMLWHIENTRTLGFEDVRVRSWDEVIARVKAIR